MEEEITAQRSPFSFKVKVTQLESNNLVLNQSCQVARTLCLMGQLSLGHEDLTTLIHRGKKMVFVLRNISRGISPLLKLE